MNDEKYVFINDCAEKKRTARGIHNKRTHAGKGGKVIFPSDYLTRKEGTRSDERRSKDLRAQPPYAVERI